nr:reverse transcriptase domain, reverse transcriptase zinc-binding domain protein [Tanacetum cinerariifolium]
MRRGEVKVSWEVVCLPKKEGGLGLKRLELFNKALMVSHIWNLLVCKESLWVKWIHEYKLRGWHIFEILCRGEVLPTLAYEIKQQGNLGARISHSLKIYRLTSKYHQSS